MTNSTTKRVLLSFFGTIDKKGNVTTIGDLMAIYNVALWLRPHVQKVDVGWNGNLFDLNPLCVSTDDLNKKDYDAMVYVCGPLTAGHRNFFSQFSSIKKIAIGVSITAAANPGELVDAVYIRDSNSESNFDLALADVGYPHFKAHPKIRDDRIAICLVGDQAEYGADDGYEKAANIVDRATEGYRTVPVQTLLDPSRPIPAGVELDLQSGSSLITTRLHGALLAIYHDVPVISVDQIKGGAKVSRLLSKLDWPVLNAWNTSSDHVFSQLVQYRATHPSDHLKHSRNLLIKHSRLALEQAVAFILDELTAT